MLQVNNLEEYFIKYIKNKIEDINFIHVGCFGKGIYDFKNKKMLIEENDEIVLYIVFNELAYEKKRFPLTDMFKAINFFIEGE